MVRESYTWQTILPVTSAVGLKPGRTCVQLVIPHAWCVEGIAVIYSISRRPTEVLASEGNGRSALGTSISRTRLSDLIDPSLGEERARAGDGLSHADAVSLVELTGRLAMMHASPREWRVAMLTAICEHLRAAVGVSCVWKNVSMQTPPTILTMFDVGFANEAVRGAYLREVQSTPFHDLFSRRAIEAFTKMRASTLTVAQSDLATESEMAEDRILRYRRQMTGLRECVLSIHRRSEGRQVMVLQVFRLMGDARPFSLRDQVWLDVLHAGLETVYGAEEKAHRLTHGSALSPRLKQTMDHLLANLTERQIAGAMSLSVHTVHDYVKALYAHFGVSSRRELRDRMRAN